MMDVVATLGQGDIRDGVVHENGVLWKRRKESRPLPLFLLNLPPLAEFGKEIGQFQKCYIRAHILILNDKGVPHATLLIQSHILTTKGTAEPWRCNIHRSWPLPHHPLIVDSSIRKYFSNPIGLLSPLFVLSVNRLRRREGNLE